MGEKMMRRPQKWQKISANDTSGKDLVSRIYIKTLTTQQQKDKQPN